MKFHMTMEHRTFIDDLASYEAPFSSWISQPAMFDSRREAAIITATLSLKPWVRARDPAAIAALGAKRRLDLVVTPATRSLGSPCGVLKKGYPQNHAFQD